MQTKGNYSQSFPVSPEMARKEQEEIDTWYAYQALPWWKRLFKPKPPFPLGLLIPESTVLLNLMHDCIERQINPIFKFPPK